MNPAILAIATRLEREGKKQEAAAIKAVAGQYKNLNLADLMAMVAQVSDLPAPPERVAQVDRLMDAFKSSAQQLARSPEAMSGLLQSAVSSGVAASGDMIAAAGGALEAFRVAPDVEMAYTQHAADRLERYWGKEQRRFADEVQSVLLEGLERGQSSQQMSQRLRERVQVSRSRANLIVRNELGNASANAQQQTQAEAGITHYTWVTAHDERVRPEHKARDGKVFAWDAPPSDGHPGQAVQCRCVSVPVIPTEMAQVDPSGLPQEPYFGPDDDRPKPTPPRVDMLKSEGMYPAEETTEKVFATLAAKYGGHKPIPAQTFAFTAEDYAEQVAQLRVSLEAAKGAAAFYRAAGDGVPDTVLVGPWACAMLKSSDIAENFMGVRYLSHEYFHAMRLDTDRVLAFEEAGAELFANRAMQEMTGLSGDGWPVAEYSPLVQGVELIGQRLGRPDTLDWLLESRREKSQWDWLYGELGRIPLKEEDIPVIMNQSADARQWLTKIRALLEGTDK